VREEAKRMRREGDTGCGAAVVAAAAPAVVLMESF